MWEKEKMHLGKIITKVTTAPLTIIQYTINHYTLEKNVFFIQKCYDIQELGTINKQLLSHFVDFVCQITPLFTLLFLAGNIKLDGIPTKIKWTVPVKWNMPVLHCTSSFEVTSYKKMFRIIRHFLRKLKTFYFDVIYWPQFHERASWNGNILQIFHQKINLEHEESSILLPFS